MSDSEEGRARVLCTSSQVQAGTLHSTVSPPAPPDCPPLARHDPQPLFALALTSLADWTSDRFIACQTAASQNRSGLIRVYLKEYSPPIASIIAAKTNH